ncbi:MAG: VanZ family protein [Bacilli bacterium]|nr:VanZ family protein [Bacilli bacterium]
MIRYLFWLISIITFYFLISEITDILNIFYRGTAIILTLLFAATVITFELNKNNISFVCYLVFVAVFLLFRHPPENNFNFEFYLWKWFKIIAYNRTAFINIIGNLILFMPMIFYINNRYNLLFVFGFILLFETIQFITWRGVFDVVDIVLNATGAVIGKSIQKLNKFFSRQYS